MEEKMKYLVIGSSNMVGHVVALYLQEHGNEVFGYDEKAFPQIETFIGSLYEIDKIHNCVLSDGYDAVINCSAVINQKAEDDKAAASFINAFLPHYLEKITEGTGTIIVHRSTDCIFSGDKGKYSLVDIPDGRSFYAKTKAIGELNNRKDISLRTSLVGPETEENGESLFNWFYHQSGEVNGFANAIWTGLTTIEFAKVIDALVRKRAHGIFQCVPHYGISKYELLCLFEQYFPANRSINCVENKLVDKSLLQEMNGVQLQIADYDTMVEEMAVWVNAHRDIYKNYHKGEIIE